MSATAFSYKLKKIILISRRYLPEGIFNLDREWQNSTIITDEDFLLSLRGWCRDDCSFEKNEGRLI